MRGVVLLVATILYGVAPVPEGRGSCVLEYGTVLLIAYGRGILFSPSDLAFLLLSRDATVTALLPLSHGLTLFSLLPLGVSC